MEKEKCKQRVWRGIWAKDHKCSRTAVKDGFCKQHHPDAVKSREEKSLRRYEENKKNEPKLNISSARIAELEQALEIRTKEAIQALVAALSNKNLGERDKYREALLDIIKDDCGCCDAASTARAALGKEE